MKNRIKTYLVTGILLVFSCYLLPVNAQNITVTDLTPQIFFDDTTIGQPGFEWDLVGNQNFFGFWDYNTLRYLIFLDNAADMQLEMLASTFRIQDEADNTIVSVHRNAPEVALDIQSNGDVALAGGDVFIDTSLDRLGIGTTIPGDDLEVRSFAPRILFNDSSTNSTAWLVGNIGNDFVLKTLTNGTGGPAFTEIMTLDAQTGFVGVGVPNPTAELHVKGAANRVNLIVENSGTGAAKLNLKNSESNWLFNANSTLRVTTGGVTAELFIWPTSGNTEIRGTLTTGGAITSGGPTCNVGCDEVFAPEFKLDSIEDHATQMWANSYLPAVGPTEANKPMNLTEKTGGMLNELEMAHIYIEQLHTRNLSLEQQVKTLQQSAVESELHAKSMQQRLTELEQQNQRVEELVMRLVTNQTEQIVMN